MQRNILLALLVLASSACRVGGETAGDIYTPCDVGGPRWCSNGLVSSYCLQLEGDGSDGGVGSGMCSWACEDAALDCPASADGRYCLGVNSVGALDPLATDRFCFKGCVADCPSGLRCVERDTELGLLKLCLP